MTALSTVSTLRLYLTCRQCGHHGSIRLRELAERTPDRSVEDVVNCAKCGACGARGQHDMRLAWCLTDDMQA